MDRGLWQDWVNVVFGVWLFISPFFGIGIESPAAVWNAYIMGLAIALIALAAVSQPRKWEEWINLIIGVWLIIAPFALDFTYLQGATWNQIIVGLLVAADAVWAMQMPIYRVRHHA